jgi:Hypoxia induced protein conserved region
MGDWLFYLGGAACLATLCVLAFGIGGFGSGRITSRGQNRLMRWRIIAQATAVVLLVLAVLVAKGG